jgi:hypothetical protein
MKTKICFEKKKITFSNQLKQKEQKHDFTKKEEEREKKKNTHLNQFCEKLAFSLVGKSDVEVLVALDGALGRHQIFRAQMTDPRLKKKIFRRIFEKIVCQISNASFFVNFDGTRISKNRILLSLLVLFCFFFTFLLRHNNRRL